MKLHFACGRKILPGFINVDYCPGDGVDTVWDLAATPYPWIAASEIIFSHAVEHLSRSEGRACLRECYRLLGDEGTLWLVFPDLKKIVELYMKGPADLQHNERWLVDAIFETQADERVIHKYGYTEQTMRQLLTEIGFTTIETLQPGTYKFGGAFAFEIRPAVTGLKVRP